MRPLGGLLRRSNTALILVKIGDSIELASCRLDIIPDLASLGRGALGADEVVDAGLKKGKGILDMNALGEAGAQERSVYSEKDPGAALEQDHAEDQAQPQHDLEVRNHRHGRVIVLLDKYANGLRSGVLSVLRLRVRRGAGRSVDPLRRDEGGDEVRPDVCRNMENRVDAVRKEGQGILGHEQPNQGKDCKSS